MNYLFAAYALILAGIIGYQVSLFVRAKILDDFLQERNKKTGK